MIIRQYKSEDYKPMIDLLIKANVEPPAEESDLEGFCIVAEEEGQLIGCIWALVGLSTQCYVDYFAIHPNYQRTKLGWNLLQVMDNALKQAGIKRFSFYVEPDNKYFISLMDKSDKITKLRDLKFFRREIGD